MDHSALREYLLHSFYVVFFCGLKKSKKYLTFSSTYHENEKKLDHHKFAFFPKDRKE